MSDIGNKKTRALIKAKYGNRCAYCGRSFDCFTFHIDHIEPLNRKQPNAIHGENTIENYNPACQTCNSSKSNKSLEEWRQNISDNVFYLLFNNSGFNRAVKMGLITMTGKKAVFYFETL